MTTSEARELVLRGSAATVDLGRRLGAAARLSGGVVSLSGELGAGKTTFVKGLAEGLGVAEARDVTSPTFVRVVRFEAPGGSEGAVPLVHVDAYRMRSAAEVFELGLEEDMAAGACVALEWPEHVEAALPADRVRVSLEHVDEGTRRARVEAGGPASAAWLARVSWEGL